MIPASITFYHNGKPITCNVKEKLPAEFWEHYKALVQVTKDIVRAGNGGLINPHFPLSPGMVAQLTPAITTARILVEGQ